MKPVHAVCDLHLPLTPEGWAAVYESLAPLVTAELERQGRAHQVEGMKMRIRLVEVAETLTS